MGAGMLMGTYSFEGPLPPPKFVGDYGDFVRLLIRQAHGYGIVFWNHGHLCGARARAVGVCRCAKPPGRAFSSP